MEIEKRLLELQMVQELQLRCCFVRNIDLDILLQDIRTFTVICNLINLYHVHH
jgi:hypothetical protein